MKSLNPHFQLFLHVVMLSLLFPCESISQNQFKTIALADDIHRYDPFINSNGRFGDDGWAIKGGDEITSEKFTLDGASDFIVTGESGIGLIALLSNNKFTTVKIARPGSSLGDNGWRVNRNDKVVGVGYFHPNYKHDFIIQSTSQLGIISLDDDNNFITTSIAENRSRLGSGWRLNRGDQILGVGNFNGDNQMDFIIKSTSHLGIISVNDTGNFSSLAIGLHGYPFGDSSWPSNRNDQILGVGDFNGDGHSDFIVKSNTQLGIISLDDTNNFTLLTSGLSGNRLGNTGWVLNPSDQILGVGDFNDDGRSDFIIKSNTNLGIISLDDTGSFTALPSGATGYRLSNTGWVLNQDDQILGVGDFDGDDRSDFIIKSSSHLGIISTEDMLNFRSVITLSRNYPSNFGSWGRIDFHDEILSTGDFDGDRKSDFIIRRGRRFGIIGIEPVESDIIRYYNVDDCQECSTAQNDEIAEVINEMMGIKGGDPNGDFIGNAAALKVPRGKNWYPVQRNRQILCGSYKRFGINTSPFFRGDTEVDWNIVITPSDNFTRLIDDVKRWQYGLLDRHDWLNCSGVPCMEAEVTPPSNLYDYEAFSVNDESTTLDVGDGICVYGPWVREEVHGNRPEIHPSELLWWQGSDGEKYMIIVQDGSDRFDERRNFRGDKPRDWKPWAGTPMIKQFKIAFDKELGADTEQYTLDIGRQASVVRSSDRTVRQDVLPGRRYALEKEGNVPILVVEDSTNDDILEVQFESVCYNSLTNRLNGYIVVKAIVGQRDGVKGGFLEIILRQDNISIRE